MEQNKHATEAEKFLFARWIGINYDGNLNHQDGNWWADKLNHFNRVVLPNYKENKTFGETVKFLGGHD